MTWKMALDKAERFLGPICFILYFLHAGFVIRHFYCREV